FHVTGVQTCALPIYRAGRGPGAGHDRRVPGPVRRCRPGAGAHGGARRRRTAGEGIRPHRRHGPCPARPGCPDRGTAGRRRHRGGPPARRRGGQPGRPPRRHEPGRGRAAGGRRGAHPRLRECRHVLPGFRRAGGGARPRPAGRAARMSAMSKIPVLTIDGPSGSGKGTISRAVAERLGWHYLDSGALYRAVGLAAAWEGLDLSDGEAVAQCAARTQIRFETAGEGEPRVIVNGKDATRLLRTETAGAAASAIAAHPPVRAALVALQHSFRKPPGLVADGRDMGTVIFPDAAWKVFLTASAEERARRRYKQLKEKGVSVNLADL